MAYPAGDRTASSGDPTSKKPNPYAKAKAKDANLDSYIKMRNSSNKGTMDYAMAQNKINEAYGVSKRHSAPAAPKMETRGAVNVNTGERLKVNNNAVGKGGNNNSSINAITSNTQGTGGNKVASSSMKPITLTTDLDAALKSKFGANSATSTSNMSLMKGKVDAPKSIVDQTGIPDASELESRSPVYDRKGREKIGGMSYSDGEKNFHFGKGSTKTKGEFTKRQRDVLYNEEGKKMGVVKRNMETNTYDVKRTRRGKAAEKARLEKGRSVSNESVAQSLYDQEVDKYL